jgi:hypothetical protein
MNEYALKLEKGCLQINKPNKKHQRFSISFPEAIAMVIRILISLFLSAKGFGGLGGAVKLVSQLACALGATRSSLNISS